MALPPVSTLLHARPLPPIKETDPVKKAIFCKTYTVDFPRVQQLLALVGYSNLQGKFFSFQVLVQVSSYLIGKMMYIDHNTGHPLIIHLVQQ